MRARTPRNSGTLKNIGKFPSLKNKSTVWFESHLEKDFIYLIEFDKSVIKYQEQPFKIKYFLNGKPCIYTPDFFIEKPNKKQVIEIKPPAWLCIRTDNREQARKFIKIGLQKDPENIYCQKLAETSGY